MPPPGPSLPLGQNELKQAWLIQNRGLAGTWSAPTTSKRPVSEGPHEMQKHSLDKGGGAGRQECGKVPGRKSWGLRKKKKKGNWGEV